MESLQGHLLVATRDLLDPNFRTSVVLLVQHNEDGALGLVLNRPAPISFQDAWSQISEEPCHVEGPIFWGGPCEGPLMALHANPLRAELDVVSGLFFCSGAEHLEQLVGDDETARRFYAGYSGWGSGQLERELGESSWITVPATPDDVFGNEDELWERITRRVTSEQLVAALKIKHVPQDPRMN